MYDQDAVRAELASAGERAGPLDINYGVTEDGSAIFLEVQDQKAFFTPMEVRDALEEMIEVAQLEAWLHDPETLYAIAHIHDLAKGVDRTNEVAIEDIRAKWRGITMRSYDFEEDPQDLRQAILEIYERNQNHE